MDTEVKAFLDKLEEKLKAKSLALVAMGEAKAAEAEGKTAQAETAWASVATYGLEGTEGRCIAEMQAMADAYVIAHPELFTYLQPYIKPDASAKEQEQAQDTVVTLAGTFKKQGDLESYGRVTMWELANFPRKHIGSQLKIQYRIPGLGGSK